MDLPLTHDPLLAAPPPVLVHRPARQTAALVYCSPHSGRHYPAEFVAASRLDPLRLRRSEDGFVEELFAAAPAHGAPLVAATFPRAYCDANREAWELDPGMFAEPLPPWVNSGSPRVLAGLGTIARVVASGEAIYRDKLPLSQAEARISGLWHPFHAALRGEISTTRDMFGACLVIDCHSMPGGCMGARPPADIVLGDGHGTTCAPRIMRRVEELLRDQGFIVRRNDPYAGGYITRHYGRPREGVHAVQIEISRPLYMDESRIERSAGFADMQARLGAMVAGLAASVPVLDPA